MYVEARNSSPRPAHSSLVLTLDRTPGTYLTQGPAVTRTPCSCRARATAEAKCRTDEARTLLAGEDGAVAGAARGVVLVSEGIELTQ